MKINYGLVVIDPLEEGSQKTVLHFCGYQDEPNDEDIENLRKELMEDPEFGLTDIAYRLDIIPSPQDILEEYKKVIEEEFEGKFPKNNLN